jgi:elongation of very long chain fatty acids protein 4
MEQVVVQQDHVTSRVQQVAQLIRHEIDDWYSTPHRLSAGYPLIEARILLLGVVGYLAMVAWGLNRAARDAKPIIQNGRWAMRAYNFGQVVLSGYIAYLASITFLKDIFATGIFCQSMRNGVTNDQGELQTQAFCAWLFYMSKWVDFMDTFFIITRSKWRQLSFLHTFHHSTMIVLTWMATYYFPCGYFLIAAQLNAPVHFIMYFYYLLSSFPGLTKFLWWKKYITSVQLIQFVIGFFGTGFCVVQSHLGLRSGICNSYAWAFVMYTAFLYYLFSSFYRQTYRAKSTDTAVAAGKRD